MKPGILSLAAAIAKMTAEPARVLGLPEDVGTLKPGAPADVAVLDLEKVWKVDRNALQSKSKNTPFDGWELQGKAVFTLVGGKRVQP